MNKVKIALILFGLCFVFFNQFFRGQVLFCCDNLLINIPARSYLFSQLSTGVYPLWNPYIFSGSPFLADLNLSPLYPGVFIEYMFSHLTNLFTLLSLSVFVHVVIALVGGYWCCRLIKIDRGGSLVGAMTYGFSGTMITYVHNMPMLQVAALLPWVLGAMIQLTHTASPKWFITFVVLSSLQIIAGHPQLTFYSWFIYGTYYLVFSKKSWLSKLVDIFVVIISVCLLTSIQLIPFIEFVLQSTRLGGDYAYATQGSLPLTALIRFVLPSVVGDIRQGTDWWQGGSVYGFVGAISLIVALSVVKRNKLTIYLFIIGLLSLLASFGNNLPIFSIFYSLVPGVSLFRVPAHFLLVYTVCMSLLTGYGFMSIDVLKKKQLFLPGLIISLSICLLGLLFHQQLGEHAYNLAISKELFLAKIGFLQMGGITLIFQQILMNLLFILVVLFTFFLVSINMRKRLIFVALVLELFFYSRTNLVTIDTQVLQGFQDNAASLVESLSTKNGSRLYSNPNVYPSPYKKTFGNFGLDEEIQWQFQSLRPNISVLYQTRMVNGYASLTYKKYQEYFNTQSKDPTGIVIPERSDAVLQRLSTRVILNRPPCASPCDMPIEIATDTQALPYSRIETVTSAMVPVFAQENTHNYMLFTIDSTESGKLVVAETNYPGWKVRVNGNSTSFLEGLLLSVNIPSGHSQVEFVYAPTSVKLGGLISGGMVLLVVLSSGYILLSNKKIITTKKHIQ